MHFILCWSLGKYFCIPIAIISRSSCQISTGHEGLNLKVGSKGVATGLSRKGTDPGLRIMKDGRRNPSYLGNQEWKYFCIGSRGEVVSLYRFVSKYSEVTCVGADTMVFCKAWSNGCWDRGVIMGISVTFGWCCRWPMKFDFEGGCLLPQNHFVSQIQQCVWEVSQRKMGLTSSRIVPAKNLLSRFSAPSLDMPLKWSEETDSCGLFGDWSRFPGVPGTRWALEGWTDEQLHKALVHSSLKIL